MVKTELQRCYGTCPTSGELERAPAVERADCAQPCPPVRPVTSPQSFETGHGGVGVGGIDTMETGRVYTSGPCPVPLPELLAKPPAHHCVEVTMLINSEMSLLVQENSKFQK